VSQYAQRQERAGALRVLVDGEERLAQVAAEPFTDVEGNQHYLENRKGILGLGFGLHRVRLEAVEAPVSVLGLFTYDSRPNLQFERRLTGRASAGETVAFSPPFRARPVVICHDGLSVSTDSITPSQVTFRGEGSGIYQVIGE